MKCISRGNRICLHLSRRGYIDAVKELLPYTTKEGICLKNKSGFNVFLNVYMSYAYGFDIVHTLIVDIEPDV